MSEPPTQPLATRLWLAVSSPLMAGLLALASAGLIALAARSPQGAEAITRLAAARDPELETAVAWGLTDLQRSPIAWALGLLLGLSLIALIARALLDQVRPPAPAQAEHAARWTAAAPEWAVERVEALLGHPQSEAVDGAQARLFYRRGGSGRWAAVLMQTGLIICLLGAAASLAPPPQDARIARLQVEVTDRETGTQGRFELREGEQTQLFSPRRRYTLLGYLPSRAGLGSAVAIEAQQQLEGAAQPQRTRFWLYEDAPPGFDHRHRPDQLSFEPLEMGWTARPGVGLSVQAAGLLLSAGVGLLLLGWLAAQRPRGWLWVTIDGATVELRGAPARRHDPAFGARFAQLSVALDHALHD